MKGETNEKVNERFAEFCKHREKLFSDAEKTLKSLGFSQADFTTTGTRHSHNNTTVALTRGSDSRELSFTITQATEGSYTRRDTPYPRVSVSCVSPQRTLSPKCRYVDWRKTWSLVKGESVAKVLDKAFDQSLAEEARDKAMSDNEQRQQAIAQRVNDAAGCDVCSVVSRGWGSRASPSKAEVQLVGMDEATLIAFVTCLRTNGLLGVLKRGIG